MGFPIGRSGSIALINKKHTLDSDHQSIDTATCSLSGFSRTGCVPRGTRQMCGTGYLSDIEIMEYDRGLGGIAILGPLEGKEALLMVSSGY